MVITSQTKKRSTQERKLLKNRKKSHKVPIGVISHFFTVNNFFISTPSERSFSPDVVVKPQTLPIIITNKTAN